MHVLSCMTVWSCIDMFRSGTAAVIQVGDCNDRFQGVRSLWVAWQKVEKVLGFTESRQSTSVTHYITLDVTTVFSGRERTFNGLLYSFHMKSAAFIHFSFFFSSLRRPLPSHERHWTGAAMAWRRGCRSTSILMSRQKMQLVCESWWQLQSTWTIQSAIWLNHITFQMQGITA